MSLKAVGILVAAIVILDTAATFIGTPLTRSWAATLPGILFALAFPLLFGAMILWFVRKGQNPDGTSLPSWQRVAGLLFAIVLIAGVGGWTLYMMNKTVEGCLSNGQVLGYFSHSSPYRGDALRTPTARCVDP